MTEPAMRLEAWADSNIGLVRQTNQDSVGCYPEQRLFVVADGMGGRSAGEVASALAVEALRERFVHEAPTEAPGGWRGLLGLGTHAEPASPEDLTGAIALANERIYAAGQAQTDADASQRGSMGTTVVALWCDVAGRRAHWAYVGDSRLYRRRAGALALLTADHTLIGEPFWSAEEIPIELPHTNRLVRALGITPGVQMTVRGGELLPGDLYLLCSDGVSGMVAPELLIRLLAVERPLADMGAAIIQAALDGGGKDNASALLVRVLAE